MKKTLGIINMDKESPLVKQAFCVAKADIFYKDEDLILELSELLAKHTVKAMLKIQDSLGAREVK